MNDQDHSLPGNAPRHFSHARLEEVIYGRIPLRELLGRTPAAPGELLADYVVADYVGSHQLDRERFGAGDLIQASARIFFEDSGAFVDSVEGAPHGRDFNLVLFATFAVIEIAPYTAQARFLVLSPAPATIDGPYAGLVRSCNTDALRERLAASTEHTALFDDLEDLLDGLTEDPQPRPQRRGLLQRLFRH
ncbi:MAG: hypothetical protein LPK58_04040 [Gammaproteobacteria bacterium]|nr:hypothetical protein [Gammaproteobacteria bacterium]MDX5374853.1 hypothetical protein [Gammaproteobacteria bacterium]